MNPDQSLRRTLFNPAILAVCGIVLLARKPDLLLRPQFWAEDGHFFQEFYVHGWSTLFTPYAGYLHSIPRMVAGSSFWWDPLYAPAWFVGCAAAVTLYVCARCLSSRQLLPGGPLAALAVVTVPDAFEVILNLTNLQWIVAVGLALLLLSRDPDSKLAWVHDTGVAIVAGLTGPFSLLLTPCFVARGIVRKTRASWILATLIALTGTIQLHFILQFQELPTPNASIDPSAGLGAIGTRLAGSLFTGGRVSAQSPVGLRWLLALITVGLVLFAGLRRDERQPVYKFLTAFFALVLAASLYRCRWVLPDLQQPGYGARYFFPLQLMVIWLIISALYDARPLRRRFALVSLLLALTANVGRLREASLDDLHWEEFAPKIRANEPVVIPINPTGWTISLPGKPASPP